MMRKGTDAQRFPNSVVLFKFCLRALEFRSKSNKIHDQAIGEILNFNPSDTSHWKRGKKSVRSIYALQTLAETLNIETELLNDIASGDVDFDEAWLEFLDAEEEKKRIAELLPEQWALRHTRAAELEVIACNIREKAQINTAPIFVPEILNVLPFILANAAEVSDKIAWSSRLKPGQYSIRFRKGDMRPHTRLALVREIARVVCYSERDQFDLGTRVEELSYLEILDFAVAILVPKKAFLQEVEKLSLRNNLVNKLATIFWVPKCVIRSRLASLTLESASPSVYLSLPLNTNFATTIPVQISAASFAD